MLFTTSNIFFNLIALEKNSLFSFIIVPTNLYFKLNFLIVLLLTVLEKKNHH